MGDLNELEKRVSIEVEKRDSVEKRVSTLEKTLEAKKDFPAPAQAGAPQGNPEMEDIKARLLALEQKLAQIFAPAPAAKEEKEKKESEEEKAKREEEEDMEKCKKSDLTTKMEEMKKEMSEIKKQMEVKSTSVSERPNMMPVEKEDGLTKLLNSQSTGTLKDVGRQLKSMGYYE